MNSQPSHSNTFVDAGGISPNRVVRGFQWLYWVFLRPSAWRDYINHANPGLQADFTAFDLQSRPQYKNSFAIRWINSNTLICVLLVALIVGGVLLFSNNWLANHLAIWAQIILGQVVAHPPIMNPVPGTLYGVGFGISIALSISLFGRNTFGFAPALATGLAAGIIGGILVGSDYIVPTGHLISPTIGLMQTLSCGHLKCTAVGISTSVSTGLISGLAGSLVGALSGKGESQQHSYFWWINNVMSGVFIAGLVLGIGLGLAALVKQILFAIFPTSNLPENFYSPTFGIVLGLGYGLYLGRQTGRWLSSCGLGLILGLVISSVYSLMITTLMQDNINESYRAVLLGTSFGSSNGILFCAAFSLPCLLIGRQADNSWLRAIAGALGSGGILILFSALSSTHLESGLETLSLVILGIGLPSLFIGLTRIWWQPILLYPFEFLWNLALYRIDKQRPGSSSGLIRWHSVFWDGHQWLPFPELSEYLVFSVENYQMDGAIALERLSIGKYRAAAQAAQIELDIRHLEKCQEISLIGRVHSNIIFSNLLGPASSLLRAFSRVSQDVDAALAQPTSYGQRLALKMVEERLDGLLHEMTRSGERYAVRFYPAATLWRQVVGDYIRFLASVIKIRQEIDNPYIIGTPLTAKDGLFIGRMDIGIQIEQLLRARNSPPLLLFGQRRMGKTSLLYNLKRMLPSTDLAFLIDGQYIVSAANYPELLWNIYAQISNSYKQQCALQLPALIKEDLEFSPFACFNTWLDAVETDLDKRGVRMALLALDEFEALDDVLAKSNISIVDFGHLLRHLIQHRPRFKLLLSTSHTLDELRHWASYLINTQVIKLGGLNPPEARQLIEKPVRDFPLRYTEDAITRALDLTRGHPLLVQLLCYKIVELKNKQPLNERLLVFIEDVDAAIPLALENGSFFFVDIENQIGPHGTTLLRSLANYGAGAIVSRDVLSSHNLPPLENTLKLLLQRDIIECVSGGYRFQIELIRQWFDPLSAR